MMLAASWTLLAGGFVLTVQAAYFDSVEMDERARTTVGIARNLILVAFFLMLSHHLGGS